MTDTIKFLISKNDEFSECIERMAAKLEIENDNKREMILVGFFNNTRVHFYSMNLLIEKKLYNSAFALVRIFFESIIKGRYVYMFFEDTKIDKMYGKDDWDSIFKKEPKIGEMCEKIDCITENNFYMKIQKNAYKKMNDFTHTGAYQITSNFNVQDGLIEPSFNDELITDTLKGNFELMKTFALFSLEILGFKKGLLTKDDMDIIFAKEIQYML